jgi:hypothetical protein
MTYIAIVLFQEMELLLITYFIVAHIVVVLGDLSDLRRPFVNHDYERFTAGLLSPHTYGQFTTELLSHGYSNITLDLRGSKSSSLVARQECETAGYGA